jgi:UDP-3-O-[3-hydroxymyristoyl] glucosamine N-acyltransferase
MKIENLFFNYLKKKIKINFKLNMPKWFSSIENVENNTIAFVSKFNNINIQKINKCKNILLLVKEKNPNINSSIVQIQVDNPKLFFFQFLEKFWVDKKNFEAKVGKKTKIYKNTFIGKNVIIGSNCEILPGVVINNNVIIGNNCIIKSNSVIGQNGFGTILSKENNLINLKHLGGVIIGDNVEVGALSTIVQGTLDNTVIGNFNKLDDHVHIGHNVITGENNQFCAGTIIGGSAKIGNYNFFGLNSTVKDNITVGNNNILGQLGSLHKSIQDRNVLFGPRNLEIKKRILSFD